MLSFIIYHAIKQTSNVIENMYCMYRDLTNKKNVFSNNVALIEGEPTCSLIRNITVELIERNIHVILVVDKMYDENTLSHLFHNDIMKNNSSSTIHTISKQNIYSLADRIKSIDLNIKNWNIDILILNHIYEIPQNSICDKTYNTNTINQYESSSIISRQFMPNMINQSYGKIIYIEPYPYSCNKNNTDTNHISESSLSELNNHGIIVSHVIGPDQRSSEPDLPLSYKHKLDLAKGVGRCLDYDFTTYSTEPLIYNWWITLNNCIE